MEITLLTFWIHKLCKLNYYLTVVRERKIQTPLRANQIVGFVSMQFSNSFPTFARKILFTSHSKTSQYFTSVTEPSTVFAKLLNVVSQLLRQSEAFYMCIYKQKWGKFTCKNVGVLIWNFEKKTLTSVKILFSGHGLVFFTPKWNH